MSDDFKYKQMIEDDIDKTKISSNNDISDNDSIEEKIRISKLKSSSRLKHSIYFLRYASFVTALLILVAFYCHFYGLSDKFETVTNIYKETKTSDILWLYGFSIFSTVLVIVSIGLGLINIFSNNKIKRGIESSHTAYFKEIINSTFAFQKLS